MLEFVVPEQFEEQATEIVSQDAVRFAPRDRAKILADILTEFKGEEIAPRMSVYSVKYNEDGATAVRPIDLGFSANEHTLLNFLQDSGQTVMISKEGKSICIAPFEVNSVSYIRTFDPAEAPTIRETLGATLTPPKEPSFIDWVFNFFATHILDRPGKAVKEYNEKKAYYDAMQKGLGHLTGIADKVNDYKQEHIEEEKRREAEATQKQKELEEQKQREEAHRRELEEQKKLEIQNLKKKMDEESKQFDQVMKQQKPKTSLTEEQQVELAKNQMEAIVEAYKVLPQQGRKKQQLAESRKNLANAVKEDEKNLATIKETYAKEKQAEEKAQKALNDTLQQVKEARADLKKLNQMKRLDAKKTAATAKLNEANTNIARYKEEREQERNKAAELKKQYDAMKGDEFLYSMKPEEYIHSIYVQNSAKRKQMYDQKIEENLGKEMKQLQSDISKTQKERDDLRAKTGVLDRAPLIGGLRTNGKALNDAEEKLTRLEKRYAELKAQEQKEWDEFKAQEAKYAAIERNFSEDRIETAKNYLKQNREKGEATYKAYKAAKDRADELTTMITNENKKVTEANDELDQVKKDPLSAYKYDAAQHHQLAAQIASVEDGIETTLRPDLKFWQEKVKERGKNISAWENGIDTKRKSLEKMNGEYTLAEETFARTRTKIDSNAMLLNKSGVAVPLPPEEAVPHLQGMILFQQIMQAQGHPIQQAQPQPKPMGMGGPNG